MFGTQSYANPSRRYAAVDTGSRVEGANPHQLVKILFEETVQSIEATALALGTGDDHMAREKQTRALTLLHALESSLDFDRGGDVALSLCMIYREARSRLVASVPEKNVVKALSARDIVADIAEAWGQIG
ncbi:MAG: flagellar protein FliS [Sphingobium sp.]